MKANTDNDVARRIDSNERAGEPERGETKRGAAVASQTQQQRTACERKKKTTAVAQHRTRLVIAASSHQTVAK